MFRGEQTLSIDDKGRLAIPTKYRDRLSESCGGTLVATIGLLETCLVVYPMPEWQRIENVIMALPALDPEAQQLSHLLIGHASECELDGHGRILLSQSLRDHAGLERRVKMIGQVRKFELWNEDRWSSRRTELLGQVERLRDAPAEALRNLVL